MMPIFPATVRLFEEKNCSTNKFDDIFNSAVRDAQEGYFTISEKGEEVFLFVVGGRPYASGRIEQEGFSFLDVQEFFDTYARISAGDLSFYKVEKKLLFSILVYFKKRPSQKFSADTVNMEKVLDDLAAKGTDSLIATRCGNKMSFSICPKGRPWFNYLPDTTYAQEQPKEGILLYVFGQKDCAPSIEVFEDIHMTPAPDTIPQNTELPKSLINHYTKGPAASVSVKGAEVVLMQDNKIINQYIITKAETTIGRSLGSDILMDNPAVSRHHAVIIEKNGTFAMEDKGSVNGTFIDGEKVTKKELKHGDRIQIVNYILTFHYPPMASEDKTVYVEPSALKAEKQGISKLMLEDGRELVLKSTVMTIGSGEDMELRIEGRLIAEHQASILRSKGGEFTLVHKGGRTATKVNGAKIESQHLLKNGDVIEIGQYKIKYVVS